MKNKSSFTQIFQILGKIITLLIFGCIIFLKMHSNIQPDNISMLVAIIGVITFFNK